MAAHRSSRYAKSPNSVIEYQCLRCCHLIRYEDKVGPIKGAEFHRDCFTCYDCHQRLSKRTYFTNYADPADKEVYCQKHLKGAPPAHTYPDSMLHLIESPSDCSIEPYAKTPKSASKSPLAHLPLNAVPLPGIAGSSPVQVPTPKTTPVYQGRPSHYRKSVSPGTPAYYQQSPSLVKQASLLAKTSPHNAASHPLAKTSPHQPASSVKNFFYGAPQVTSPPAASPSKLRRSTSSTSSVTASPNRAARASDSPSRMSVYSSSPSGQSITSGSPSSNCLPAGSPARRVLLWTTSPATASLPGASPGSPSPAKWGEASLPSPRCGLKMTTHSNKKIHYNPDAAECSADFLCNEPERA